MSLSASSPTPSPGGPPPPQVPASAGEEATSPLARLARTGPLLQIVAVIVLFVVTALTISGFLTRSSVYATLLDQWLGCPAEKVLGGTFAHLPILEKV